MCPERVTSSNNPPSYNRRDDDGPEGTPKRDFRPKQKPDEGKQKADEGKEKTEEGKKKEEHKEIPGSVVSEKQAKPSEIETKGTSPVESVKAGELAGKIKQVNALIKTSLEGLQVGEKSALMTLKAGATVPNELVGAKISLAMEGQKITINFDMSGTISEAKAIQLIEASKSQIENLAQSLQAKNLTLAELSIGNNSIATFDRTTGQITMIEKPAAIFADQGSTQERDRTDKDKEERGEKEK